MLSLKPAHILDHTILDWYTRSLMLCVPLHVSVSCTMCLCRYVPALLFMSLFCVLFCMCLRRGKSLVLWAGTSAMSLMTVTGSVLCLTSTSTAKTAPSLGTLSFTSLVGKPTHIDLYMYSHTCAAQVDIFGTVYVWWPAHIFEISCILIWPWNCNKKSNVQSFRSLALNKAGSVDGNSLSLSLGIACVVLPMCCQCLAQTAHCCFVNNTHIFSIMRNGGGKMLADLTKQGSSVTWFHSVVQLWPCVCSTFTQWTFAALLLLTLCLYE